MHYVVGQFLDISKSKALAYLCNGLLLAAVFYLTLGVRDTADNFMFEYFYDNEWEKIDPMFIYLSKLMNAYGYDYYAFYRVHLITYTLAYFYLISRYTSNIFYVFLVFFVLYYVPYVNQIRYYMAFPFFLLSLHYFVYRRNLWLFALFGFLSVTSHAAIIVLYGFLPMYYLVKSKNFFRIALIASASAFTAVLLLFQVGLIQMIEHFGSYAGKGMTSSLSGGIFNALPYFMYLGYLYIVDKRYRKRNPDFESDQLYGYLSKLSFFTIIFIPSSFLMQVLGHRYVFPFIIIWVIFFLYMMRNESNKSKFLNFLAFALVHCAVGYSIYILPKILMGESHYEEELIRSLKSIKYIKNLY